MGLALSASWNSRRHNSGKGIIEEIAGLGFKEVELNFSLTKDIVEEISELVYSGRIKVSSVHNFCPIPEGISIEEALPDYYSLASLDEPQRQKAVYYTKRSIDTASRLRAKALVVHCGRNEIPDYTRRLIKLHQQGLSNTEEFLEIKEKAVKERKVTAEKHLRLALKSLDELQEYAGKQKVFLGIENRFYYREIPTPEETRVILDTISGASMRYWHDFGHAAILEMLGLCGVNEYLNLCANRLGGMHIHNVLSGVDHQPPHKGQINLKDYSVYIRKETLKVIEAHSPQASARDLIESKRYLEEILDGSI